MSTIHEAVLEVQNIYRKGWRAQQQRFRTNPELARRALENADRDGRLREHVQELSKYRSGLVTVTRNLDRSIGTCPHCGADYNAGSYIVRHVDGREVRFDTLLAHYASEGHPITKNDVDIDLLLMLMAGA